MERLARLTSDADFQRVRREGRSWAGPLFVLVTLTNGLELSRFGFTAGKAVGGAVRRNRAKRLLREAVRAHLSRIQSGWDLVWIARAPIARAKFAEVRAAVGRRLGRARVLKSESNG
ncbi:MAG: ribonuclease P protein component [Chloroflexi bacterium]|nr:ribonuclease P protein component [Chloroflexota bacterium]